LNYSIKKPKLSHDVGLYISSAGLPILEVASSLSESFLGLSQKNLADGLNVRDELCGDVTH